MLSTTVLTVSKKVDVGEDWGKWAVHGDNEQNVVIEELQNHRILVILTATPDFRIVVNERLIS